jgi:hypothetical protein
MEDAINQLKEVIIDVADDVNEEHMMKLKQSFDTIRSIENRGGAVIDLSKFEERINMMENNIKNMIINADKDYNIHSKMFPIFKQLFDFSSSDAFLSSDEILSIIRKELPDASSKKIKSFLLGNMGLNYKQKKINCVNVRGYEGIKLKK